MPGKRAVITYTHLKLVNTIFGTHYKAPVHPVPRQRGQGKRNRKRAVASFEEALKIFTREKYPLYHETAMENLDRIRGDGK